MSPSENAARMRHFIEQVDAHGELDALADYMQPDVALPADIIPNGRQGLEGMREHLLYLHDRVRYRSTVEDIVAEGDTVAARITLRGTIIAEFMDLPVNGREWTIDEFMFARFRDGKIAEVWRVADLMALVRQLDEG